MVDATLLKDQRLLNIMDMVLFRVVEVDASDDENKDDDDDEGYGDGEYFDNEDDKMSENENSDEDDEDATEDQNFTSDAIMAEKGQLQRVVSSHIYSFKTCSCKQVPSSIFFCSSADLLKQFTGTSMQDEIMRFWIKRHDKLIHPYLLVG